MNCYKMPKTPWQVQTVDIPFPSRMELLSLCLLLLLGAAYLPDVQAQHPVLPCTLDGICFCKGHQPGDLLPNCEDWASYYRCGLNSIQLVECAVGELFDVELQACVPGKCPRSDEYCTNITPSYPTPSTTSTTITTAAPGPGPTPTPPSPGSCEHNDVQCSFPGQIIPHAEHCRLFWTCVELCPELGFCERGMWFNRESFVCDFPENVTNCPVGRD